jgi:hypothetical protein
MWLLAALVLCRRLGMMECWNHGPGETETKVSRGKNNGQKRIASVFESRFFRYIIPIVSEAN